MDLRFGFLANNYAYNPLETSGTPTLVNTSPNLVNLIKGLVKGNIRGIDKIFFNLL